MNERIEELQKLLAMKQEVKEPDNKEVYIVDGVAHFLGLNGRVNFKKAYENFLVAEQKGSVYAKILIAQYFIVNVFISFFLECMKSQST